MLAAQFALRTCLSVKKIPLKLSVMASDILMGQNHGVNQPKSGKVSDICLPTS